MSNEPKCSGTCAVGPSALIYPCSGASDVGGLSDAVARKVSRDTNYKMSCLAGIGGRVNTLMVNAAAAPVLVAIDGCPHDCARKTLELAGFTNVKHIRVTDMGFKKGSSPATPEAIGKIAQAVTSTI